eukprot:gb/GECG01002000.1/.p1 GENE.gb/GECG01002000.1/~~gb/GECG01002000.1/.p1  ORF type:complete len:3567 (+),score=430.64 gb/GECG01002000.1/:1-10701(+)
MLRLSLCSNFLKSWDEFIYAYTGEDMAVDVKAHLTMVLTHKLTTYVSKDKQLLPGLKLCDPSQNHFLLDTTYLDRRLISRDFVSYDPVVGIIPGFLAESDGELLTCLELVKPRNARIAESSPTLLQYCVNGYTLGLCARERQSADNPPAEEKDSSDDYSVCLEEAGTLKAAFAKVCGRTDGPDPAFCSPLWPESECEPSTSSVDRPSYANIVYPDVPRVWFYSENLLADCDTSKRLALTMGARYIEPVSLLSECTAFPAGWGVVEVSQFYRKAVFLKTFSESFDKALAFYENLDNEEDTALSQLRELQQEAKDSPDDADAILEKMQGIVTEMHSSDTAYDPDRMLIAECITLAVEEERRFLIGEDSTKSSKKKKKKKTTDLQNPRKHQGELLEHVSSTLTSKANKLIEEVTGESYVRKEKLLLRRLARILSSLTDLNTANTRLPKDTRSVLGQLADSDLKKGVSVSEEVVRKLVRDAMIEAVEAGCGYVLDRYPYNEAEYQALTDEVRELLNDSGGKAMVDDMNVGSDLRDTGMYDVASFVEPTIGDAALAANSRQYNRELHEFFTGEEAEKYDSSLYSEPMDTNGLGKFKDDDVEHERGLRAYAQSVKERKATDALHQPSETTNRASLVEDEEHGSARRNVQISERANESITFDYRRPTSGLSFGRSRSRSRGSRERSVYTPLPDILEHHPPDVFAIRDLEDVMPTKVIRDEFVCSLDPAVNSALAASYLCSRFAKSSLETKDFVDQRIVEPSYGLGVEDADMKRLSAECASLGFENLKEEVVSYAENASALKESVCGLCVSSGLYGVNFASTVLSGHEEEDADGESSRKSRLIRRMLDEDVLVFNASDYYSARNSLFEGSRESTSEQRPAWKASSTGESSMEPGDESGEHTMDATKGAETAEDTGRAENENDEQTERPASYEFLYGIEGTVTVFDVLSCWRSILSGIVTKSHTKLLRDLPRLGWRNFRPYTAYRTGPAAVRCLPSLVKQIGSGCIGVNGATLAPDVEGEPTDEEEGGKSGTGPYCDTSPRDFQLAHHLFDGVLLRSIVDGDLERARWRLEGTSRSESSACFFASPLVTYNPLLVFDPASHVQIDTRFPSNVQFMRLVLAFSGQLGPFIGSNDAVCAQAVSLPEQHELGEEQVEQMQDLGQGDFMCGLRTEDGSVCGAWPVDESTTARIRYLLYGEVLPKQYDLMHELASLDPVDSYRLRIEGFDSVLSAPRDRWNDWSQLLRSVLLTVSLRRQQRSLLDWLNASRTTQDIALLEKLNDLCQKDEKSTVPEAHDARSLKQHCEAMIEATSELVEEVSRQEEETEQQLQSEGEGSTDADQMDSWKLDWQHCKANDLPVDAFQEKLQAVVSLVGKSDDDEEAPMEQTRKGLILAGAGGGGINGDSLCINNKIIGALLENPEELTLRFAGEEELSEQLGELDDSSKRQFLELHGHLWADSDPPEDSSEWSTMLHSLLMDSSDVASQGDKVSDSSLMRLERQWLLSVRQIVRAVRSQASRRDFSNFRTICPVSLFEDKKVLWGSPSLCASFCGKLYVFASTEKLGKFLRFPLRYTQRKPFLPYSFFPVIATPRDSRHVCSSSAAKMGRGDTLYCSPLHGLHSLLAEDDGPGALQEAVKRELSKGKGLDPSAFAVSVVRYFGKLKVEGGADGCRIPLVCDDDEMEDLLNNLLTELREGDERESDRMLNEMKKVQSGKAPSKATKEDTNKAEEGRSWLSQYKERFEQVCVTLNDEEFQPEQKATGDDGVPMPTSVPPPRLGICEGIVGGDFPLHPALWRRLLAVGVVPDLAVIVDPTRDWDSYMRMSLESEGDEAADEEEGVPTPHSSFSFDEAEHVLSVDFAPSTSDYCTTFRHRTGIEDKATFAKLVRRTVFLLRRRGVQVRVVPARGMDEDTLASILADISNPFADRIKPLALCQHTDESEGVAVISSMKHYCPVTLVNHGILNPSLVDEGQEPQSDGIQFDSLKYRIEYLCSEDSSATTLLNRSVKPQNELFKCFSFCSRESVSQFSLRPGRFLEQLEKMSWGTLNGGAEPWVKLRLPVLWLAPQGVGTTTSLHSLVAQMCDNGKSIVAEGDFIPLGQFSNFSIRVCDLEKEATALPVSLSSFLQQFYESVVARQDSVKRILKVLLRRRRRALQKTSTGFTDTSAGEGTSEEDDESGQLADPFVAVLQSLLTRGAAEFIPSAVAVSECAEGSVSQKLLDPEKRLAVMHECRNAVNSAGLSCREVFHLRNYIKKTYTSRRRITGSQEGIAADTPTKLLGLFSEKDERCRWNQQAEAYRQFFSIYEQFLLEDGANERSFKRAEWELSEGRRLLGRDTVESIMQGDLRAALDKATRHGIIKDNYGEVTQWLPKVPDAVADSNEVQHGARAVAKARMAVDRMINEIEDVHERIRALDKSTADGEDEGQDEAFEGLEGFVEGKPSGLIEKAIRNVISQTDDVGFVYSACSQDPRFEIIFFDGCRLVDEHVLRLCKGSGSSPFVTLHTSIATNREASEIFEDFNFSAFLSKKLPCRVSTVPNALRKAASDGYATSLHIALQRFVREFQWQLPEMERCKRMLASLYGKLRESKIQQFAWELRHKWCIKQVKKDRKGRKRGEKENWRKQAVSKLNDNEDFALPEDLKPLPNSELLERRDEVAKRFLESVHDGIVSESHTVNSLYSTSASLGINSVSVPFLPMQDIRLGLNVSPPVTGTRKAVLRVLNRLMGCPLDRNQEGADGSTASPLYFPLPGWRPTSIPRAVTGLQGCILPPSYASYLLASGSVDVSGIRGLCPVTFSCSKHICESSSTWKGDAWSDIPVTSSNTCYGAVRRFPVLVGRTLFFCSSHCKALSFCRNPAYFLQSLSKLDPKNVPLPTSRVAIVGPSISRVMSVAASLRSSSGAVLVTPAKAANWFSSLQQYGFNCLPGHPVTKEHGVVDKRMLRAMVAKYLQFNCECLLKGWILVDSIHSEEDLYFFEGAGISFTRFVVVENGNVSYQLESEARLRFSTDFHSKFIGTRPSLGARSKSEQPEQASSLKWSRRYGNSETDWSSQVSEACLAMGELVPKQKDEHNASEDAEEALDTGENELAGELDNLYYDGEEEQDSSAFSLEALYGQGGFFFPLDESTGKYVSLLRNASGEAEEDTETNEFSVLSSVVERLCSRNTVQPVWELPEVMDVPDTRSEMVSVPGPRSGITGGVLAISEMPRQSLNQGLRQWEKLKEGLLYEIFQRVNTCTYVTRLAQKSIRQAITLDTADNRCKYAYFGALQKGVVAPVGRLPHSIDEFCRILSRRSGSFCPVTWDQERRYKNMLLSAAPLQFACEYQQNVFLVYSMDKLQKILDNPDSIIVDNSVLETPPRVAPPTRAFPCLGGLCPVSLADYRNNTVPAYGFIGLGVSYRGSLYRCHAPNAFIQFSECPEKYLGRVPSTILFPPRPRPVPAGSTTASRLPFPNVIANKRRMKSTSGQDLRLSADADTSAPCRGYLEQSFGGVLRKSLTNGATVYAHMKHPTMTQKQTLYYLLALDIQTNNPFADEGYRREACRWLERFHRECMFDSALLRTSGPHIRVIESLRIAKQSEEIGHK